MTLGTGVFLSALLLGLIQLFLQTRDRWRWRRILTVVAAITVLVPLGAFGIWWTSDFVSNRPKKVVNFLDVEMGMPKNDVTFLLGKPDEITKSKNWIYNKKEDRPLVVISFTADRVDRIATVGEGDAVLANIRMNDDYQTVIERLGKPEVVGRSKDNLSRTLHYPTLGVVIGVSGGKVEYLAAYDGRRNVEFAN